MYLRSAIVISLRAILLFTLLLGIAYPLAVTALARLVFPAAAAGSPVERGGRIVGSRWIGQRFTDPGYFWSRPSATAARPYDASASSGSNLGPTHPALAARLAAEAERLRAAHFGAAPIPADLATTSASGLDPHVSPAAALYQVERVANARGLDPATVRALVESRIEERWLGLFGEPRVNVLELNLALDEAGRRSPPP
jgi:K+-transporting ATPase ATPase C chain